MEFAPQDQFILALLGWRENRGGGLAGMQSCMNVAVNSATRRGVSVWAEATTPNRYSSLTTKGNPELNTFAADSDTSWVLALGLAARAAASALPDLTNGATLYYAPKSIVSNKTFVLPNGASVPFPEDWNLAVVEYTASIANQLFFKET